MTGSFVRVGAFVLGLLGFRAAEVLEPHHAPTAPVRLRWVTNLSLGLVNGILVSLLCASCFVLTAQGRLPAGFAPLPRLTSNVGAQILVAVVLLDFLTYSLHRAYHRIPFLWRFHVVHHTDLDLDVSSATRFHTGEVLFSSIAKLGAITVVGIPPAGLIVFEVAILACSQFQHANIRIPARLEPILWKTLVPPAMHRIHHVPKRRDTDSNFGTILTLWDSLLGTLNRRAADDQPWFGIPQMRDPKVLSLGALAVLPFQRPAEG